MVDWQSVTLAGAASVLAYVGGLITKPLQTWYDERRERKQLRKAIYVEMAALLSQLVLTFDEIKRDPLTINHFNLYLKKLWPCQCYEYAKAKPIVMNLLPDITGINHIYGGIEALSNTWIQLVEDKKPKAWFGFVFCRHMNATYFVMSGYLDTKLLAEVGDGRTKRFIQGVTEVDELGKYFNSLSTSPPPTLPQP